jgi:hypothetical protein
VVAEVIGKCLAAGISLDELGVIVDDVASETAQGFACGRPVTPFLPA